MHNSTSPEMTRREVLVGAAATALLAAAHGGAIAATRRSTRKRVQLPSTAMPLKRYMATSALMADGRILIVGGYSQRWTGANQPSPLKSAVIYDPGTNQVHSVAPMIVPRARHAAVALRDGRVAVLGGVGREPTASVEIYDPRTNTWQVGPPLAQPRFDHSAVSNGDAVFVLGGSTASGVSGVEIVHPEVTASFSQRP